MTKIVEIVEISVYIIFPKYLYYVDIFINLQIVKI